MQIQTACLDGNFAKNRWYLKPGLPERTEWDSKEMGYDFILEENSCSAFGVRFFVQNPWLRGEHGCPQKDDIDCET